MTLRKFLILCPLLVPLAGCSTMGGHLARLLGDTRPAPIAVTPTMTQTATVAPSLAVDRIYRAAAVDIEARDYADALDLLQLAKAKAPDDVRVLNAIAVIYDKLGRLDLSARYYDLALAADPQSTIVKSNIRYSAIIAERFAGAGQGEKPASPGLQAAAPPPPPAVASQSVVLARAPFAPAIVTPLHAGRPLVIVNATGRAGGGEPVRAYLASAGWSVSRQESSSGAQAPSEIRYPAEHRVLAQALARTLPFSVSLNACSVRCEGLQLVLGGGAPQRLGNYSEGRKS